MTAPLIKAIIENKCLLKGILGFTLAALPYYSLAAMAQEASKNQALIEINASNLESPVINAETLSGLKVKDANDQTPSLLKKFTNLKVLDLSNSHISHTGFHSLSLLSLNLTELILNGCPKITDATLKEFLGKHPRLTSIYLSGCENITTDVLQYFPQGLVTLGLEWCPKVEMPNLRSIPKGLTTLYLSGTKVTDGALKDLPTACPNLTQLTLNMCREVTDGGINSLTQSCGKLTVLALGGCIKITDAALQSIAQNCKNLTALVLSNCSHLTIKGLMELNKLPKLHTLYIGNGRKLEGKQIREYLIQNCKNLTELNLSGHTQIADADLKKLLENCPDLTELALNGCGQITDEALQEAIQNCKNLTTLSLSGCENITAAGLQHLPKSINTLALEWGANLADEALNELPQELTTLYLSGTNITDTGLQELSERCPKITQLALCMCTEVTDTAIQNVAQNCKNLAALYLGGTQITDNAIRELSQSCPNLTQLTLNGCTKITKEGLAELGKLSNLQLVYLPNGTKLEGEQIKEYLDSLR